MQALLRSGLIAAPPMRRGERTSLAAVFDAEKVLTVLRESSPELAAGLCEFLPIGAELDEVLRSSQLRQAADALTAALADTDNAMAVWASLGLRAEEAASQASRADPVGALLEALSVKAQADSATRAPP
jgi:hypothetical protein